MQCPHCRTELHMTHRVGIEIDYCPTCRGVWLDRGELDKIVARTETEEAAYGGEDRRREVSRRDHDEDRRDEEQELGRSSAQPKKRESFWSDLFDFG